MCLHVLDMVLPAEGRQWTWEILKAALFSLMTYLKLFKNQNRVTVVQTCKMEPGGCCGYDFRCIPSSLRTWTGFPGSSAGKESTCNAEDPSSIPGSGRSPRERIGYPLQFSLASLVAQMTKNPPAMWATWVPSLGREDPLEKGMATHSSILAWYFPWTEEPSWLHSIGSIQTSVRLKDTTSCFQNRSC